MGKKEDELYRNIMNSILPFIRSNEARSQELYTQGLETTNLAKGEIGELLGFWKNIMSGKDRNKLLDFVDADSIAGEYDNAERVLSELGVRGGSRASELGNLQFDKMENIDDLLFKVKAGAPDAINQLIGMLANVGTAQVGGGSFDANSAILNAFNVGMDPYQKAKDRRTATINSIIGGVSTIAGFLACFPEDTILQTSKGFKSAAQIYDEGMEDIRIICYDLESRNRLDGEIVNWKVTPNQPIIELRTESGKSARFTPSHYVKTTFRDKKGKAVEDLIVGESVLVQSGDDLSEDIIEEMIPLNKVDVVNIKLVDRKKNYVFLTNGIFSFDDDIS